MRSRRSREISSCVDKLVALSKESRQETFSVALVLVGACPSSDTSYNVKTMPIGKVFGQRVTEKVLLQLGHHRYPMGGTKVE